MIKIFLLFALLTFSSGTALKGFLGPIERAELTDAFKNTPPENARSVSISGAIYMLLKADIIEDFTIGHTHAISLCELGVPQGCDLANRIFYMQFELKTEQRTFNE